MPALDRCPVVLVVALSSACGESVSSPPADLPQDADTARLRIIVPEVYHQMMHLTESLMVQSRRIGRFAEFKRALPDPYCRRPAVATVVDLYPAILEWARR